MGAETGAATGDLRVRAEARRVCSGPGRKVEECPTATILQDVDLLRQIACHLDRPALGNLARTCRSSFKSLEVVWTLLTMGANVDHVLVTFPSSATSLHLGRPFGTPEAISSHLVMALQSLPNLRWLSIREQSFGDADVIEIATQVSMLRKLTRLELSGHHFGAAGAQALADALQELDNLVHLDLSRNRMDSQSLAIMENTITSLPALRHLDLQGNRLSNASLPVLKRLHPLRSLDLCNNAFTEHALDVILEGIPKLTALQLAAMEMSLTPLLHNMDALTALRSLNINCRCFPRMILHDTPLILDCLGGLTRLTSLELIQSASVSKSLPFRVASRLHAAVSRLTNLHHLGWPAVDHWPEWRDTIKSLTALTTLMLGSPRTGCELSMANISQSSIQALWDALIQATQLRSLCLVLNVNTKPQLELVACITGLRQLTVSFCNQGRATYVPTSCLTTLATCVDGLNELEELRLRGTIQDPISCELLLVTLACKQHLTYLEMFSLNQGPESKPDTAPDTEGSWVGACAPLCKLQQLRELKLRLVHLPVGSSIHCALRPVAALPLLVTLNLSVHGDAAKQECKFRNALTSALKAMPQLRELNVHVYMRTRDHLEWLLLFGAEALHLTRLEVLRNHSRCSRGGCLRNARRGPVHRRTGAAVSDASAAGMSVLRSLWGSRARGAGAGSGVAAVQKVGARNRGGSVSGPSIRHGAAAAGQGTEAAGASGAARVQVAGDAETASFVAGNDNNRLRTDLGKGRQPAIEVLELAVGTECGAGAKTAVGAIPVARVHGNIPPRAQDPECGGVATTAGCGGGSPVAAAGATMTPPQAQEVDAGPQTLTNCAAQEAGALCGPLSNSDAKARELLAYRLALQQGGYSPIRCSDDCEDLPPEFAATITPEVSSGTIVDPEALSDFDDKPVNSVDSRTSPAPWKPPAAHDHTISHLHVLDLDNCSACALCSSPWRMPMLTRLNLGNLCPGPAQFNTFLRWLSRQTQLLDLTLSNMHLTNAFAGDLMRSVGKLTQLTHLSLAGVTFNNAGLMAVAQGASKLRELRWLRLPDRPLEGENEAARTAVLQEIRHRLGRLPYIQTIQSNFHLR